MKPLAAWFGIYESAFGFSVLKVRGCVVDDFTYAFCKKSDTPPVHTAAKSRNKV